MGREASLSGALTRRGFLQARGQRGFTLIELLVVLSLISILAAMGMVQHRNSVLKAQEATLKTDLFHMRDAIDQYFADKGKYPAIARRARDGQLSAEDPRGSDHSLGRLVADDSGGARSEQSVRRAGDLRRSERRRWNGARRDEIFGLEMKMAGPHAASRPPGAAGIPFEGKAASR